MTDPITDPTTPIARVISAGCAATGSPDASRAAQLLLADRAGIGLCAASDMIPARGIGAHAAAHVLAHYGEGGYRPGDFTAALIEAIVRADPTNTATLAGVYPGYVGAVRLARDTLGGIDFLRAVAAGPE